ncbi:MAG: hypothetical protein N2053_02060, partial [Chitinispirillaceae bacterium]|nr:hypothetical protein [Chitinispirillaceae bacterium]
MNLPLIRLNSKCVEFFTIIAIWTGGYLLYGTSFPFDYDSVNYALGIIEKFNVSENTPHPPGYFFHILLGKFLHLFLENPFQIQQIENILYLLLLLSVLFMIPTCNGIRVFICTLPLFLFLVGAPVHYAALAGFSGLISYLVFFTIEKKISPILL